MRETKSCEMYSGEDWADHSDSSPLELVSSILDDLPTSFYQSGHAFYVDTRSKPPRSIWQHPYDDPTYLQSLPDTHPANPNSTEAKQARSKYDEMMDKARKEREMKQQEKRSAGGKLKDKLLGSTKAEREEKRRKKAALRAKQEEEERVSLIVSSLILFYLSCLVGKHKGRRD